MSNLRALGHGCWIQWNHWPIYECVLIVLVRQSDNTTHIITQTYRFDSIHWNDTKKKKTASANNINGEFILATQRPVFYLGVTCYFSRITYFWSIVLFRCNDFIQSLYYFILYQPAAWRIFTTKSVQALVQRKCQ